MDITVENSKTHRVEVSVVITTKDRPELLFNAIDSVINQSVAASEVFIVDDGSNEPLNILFQNWMKKQEKSLPQIQIIRNEKPQGANHARNIGLTQSTGKYIAFLDDDDTWHSDKIKSQLEAIQQSNNLFCYTASNNINAHGKILKTSFHSFDNSVSIFEQLLKDNFIGCTSSIFFDRQFAIERQIKFDESLHVLQDYDFYLSFFKHTNAIIGIPKPLVNYLQIHGFNSDKTSANFKGFLHSKKTLISKYSSVDESGDLKKSLFWIGVKKCIKYPKFTLSFIKSYLK